MHGFLILTQPISLGQLLCIRHCGWRQVRKGESSTSSALELMSTSHPVWNPGFSEEAEKRMEWRIWSSWWGAREEEGCCS